MSEANRNRPISTWCASCRNSGPVLCRGSVASRRYPRSPAGRAAGAASLITHVADRPGHDRRYATSNKKIEQELGFRPEKTLESGLRQTVTWYLEHEEWWRSSMDGRYREWMKTQYGSLVSF